MHNRPLQRCQKQSNWKAPKERAPGTSLEEHSETQGDANWLHSREVARQHFQRLQTFHVALVAYRVFKLVDKLHHPVSQAFIHRPIQLGMSTFEQKGFMPSIAPPLEREMPSECPECGGDDIVENWRQGFAECRGCGLVISERLLDLGTEWRTFASDEGDDPNRAGHAANPLLDGEQGTSIGGGGKAGGTLNIALSRAQNRFSTSAADKVMISVMARIDRYCERLSLTGSVSKRAKELFKRYQDHLTLKKTSAEGESDKYVRSRALREEEINEIIASSLFIACRNEKAARTFKEICGLTKVPKKIVGATVKKMELSLEGAKTSYVRTTDDFVTRFCNFLDLPREISKAADAVATSMQNHQSVYGKTYTTVAAASIYIVTQLSEDKHKRTPKEISEVTGVADVTIRSTYRLVHPFIESVLPKDFKHPVKIADLPSP